MLDRLCNACQEYGMQLNAKKTKTMCVSRADNEVIHLKAEGKELEQVEEYVYLGTIISQDLRQEKEIRKRIGIAKSKFWENKEFMRRNLSLHLKKKLLKCYVFTVFSYGSEIWNFNVSLCRKIKSFELWCYRQIFKISWRDRVTNEAVELRAGGTFLLDHLKQKKFRYAGHILRGSSSPLHNLILEGTIEGTRARGRPRRMWMDDITGWSRTSAYWQAKRLAENRVDWRHLVANLRTEEGTD